MDQPSRILDTVTVSMNYIELNNLVSYNFQFFPIICKDKLSCTIKVDA